MHQLVARLALTAGILFIPLAAQAGMRGAGNGGDVVAQEFRLIARELIVRLESSKPGKFPALNTTALREALAATNVASTEEPLALNGNERDRKDAINFCTPRKEILVQRNRWQVHKNYALKVALVAHEYLGILHHCEKVAGSDDADGSLSAAFRNAHELAFAIQAVVDYDLRGDDPKPWVCYESLLREWFTLLKAEGYKMEEGLKDRTLEQTVQLELIQQFVSGTIPKAGIWNHRFRMNQEEVVWTRFAMDRCPLLRGCPKRGQNVRQLHDLLMAASTNTTAYFWTGHRGVLSDKLYLKFTKNVFASGVPEVCRPFFEGDPEKPWLR